MVTYDPTYLAKIYGSGLFAPTYQVRRAAAARRGRLLLHGMCGRFSQPSTEVGARPAISFSDRLRDLKMSSPEYGYSTRTSKPVIFFEDS